MTLSGTDHPHEFVCCECGQAIFAFVRFSAFDLCSTCIMLPGWHLVPELRARLAPNLPPLEERI